MREALGFFYWLTADAPSTERIATTLSRLPPEQLVLPRVVSLAEDYARSTLIEASEALVDTSHPLRLDIWLRAEERAEATWESLRTAWKDWHSIVLSSAPTYQAFTGFVEARNAIVHGLGSLTRKQSRTPEALTRTVSRLGHAGLKLDGLRVVLAHGVLDEAVQTSAGLVEWLDHEVVTRGVLPLS